MCDSLKNKDMTISIITISYNNVEGLKRTVTSVLNQSRFDMVEYIIIDGGSKDGSFEFLSTLPENIKWISENDNGISDAFNKGINLATGDIILCLNSGDILLNRNIIETVANDWQKFNVDILSYKVRVSKDVYIPATQIEDEVYSSCTEPHQGTFVSKRLYNIVGGYSEEYKIRMDFHFFARCRKLGASFKYLNEDIVKYEEGGTSMKKENRVNFWKEGLAVKLLYNVKVDYKDLIKTIYYYFLR